MAEDRRVKYTKMVLKESLLKLLEEKPISRISIKAICELADINRATFYSHYKDQYDQLDKIELEFMANINSFIAGHIKAGTPEVLYKIFDYIGENRDLCKVLLSPNGDIAFENKIARFIRSTVFGLWNAEDASSNSTDDLIFAYIVSGGVGLAKKWLSDGERSYSSRQIAELTMNLVNNGLSLMSIP